MHMIERKTGLPVELRDEVLHQEVKNLTRGHSFKISLNLFHNRCQYALIAYWCITYTIRIPLSTQIKHHDTNPIQSVNVALTIRSNAIVFELLSSEYPNDSSNVER